MLRFVFIFIALAFFTRLAAQHDYAQDYFASPLHIPLLLSGTFGELRSNHFHSGIDIKTHGKVGLPVLAAADGFVSRINISPYGYGKAIYVQHPNGYTTVYGHLQGFDLDVEEYIREEQYRLKKQELNLYPEAGRFSFKKGDTIAFSGNSGGSGGPHLHFEIRNSKSEILNPLLFGYDISDSKPPSIFNLATYTYVDEELTSVNTHKVVNISKGQYRLAGEGLLTFYGKPGFAINAIDKLDNAPNKNGYYDLSLFINDSLVYQLTSNVFSFGETRYINSHIDFAQKSCCKTTYARLFKLPNNHFSRYNLNQKIEDFEWMADSTYKVRIVLKDFAKNTSQLQYKVAVKLPDIVAKNEKGINMFAYNKANEFNNEFVSLKIPEGALYDNIAFNYQQTKDCENCLGAIYHLSSEDIPLHSYSSLKLKVTDNAGIPFEKLGIVKLDEGNRITKFVGGDYTDGFISAKIRDFGKYSIVADTIAPKITAKNLVEGQKLEVLDELVFKVSDDLSGIQSYEAYWDREWLRLYYDYKKGELVLKVSDLRSSKGKHAITIKVTDERGNIAYLSKSVMW